jgi:uncharacterized protein YnzC (UPF0291/DUF896 family)
MGAAEDRSRDDDDADFTPAERAKLRELLDLIERGARKRLRSRQPVDDDGDDKVRPTPEQIAEVRAKVRKHMKRQGAL